MEQTSVDERCRGCWQYRLTRNYRGLWLCEKRCWRKRKAIHALDLRGRKLEGCKGVTQR
jgi:hypothetical protein